MKRRRSVRSVCESSDVDSGVRRMFAPELSRREGHNDAPLFLTFNTPRRARRRNGVAIVKLRFESRNRSSPSVEFGNSLPRRWSREVNQFRVASGPTPPTSTCDQKRRPSPIRSRMVIPVISCPLRDSAITPALLRFGADQDAAEAGGGPTIIRDAVRHESGR
jgi:hypothetical protein